MYIQRNFQPLYLHSLYHHFDISSAFNLLNSDIMNAINHVMKLHSAITFVSLIETGGSNLGQKLHG